MKSLWGRRRCFYHERALTDREKRQAKNAVVQMLEADVFKIQATKFLKHPEKFRIDRINNKVYLSSIFDWFGQDFVKTYGTDKEF